MDTPGLPGIERRMRDPLMIAIVATAALLGVIYAVLYLLRGPGPALVRMPWYNPMAFTFLALTALSVAFLAFGRYRVLGDPVSFWIGTGFSGFGVGIAFYVLAWPGLLPGERSILADLPNTAGVLATLVPALLGIPMLAATLLRWPGEPELASGRWVLTAAAWLLLVTWLCALIVAFERRMPVLVTARGEFTLWLSAANALLFVLFAAGGVLSVRRYMLSGDALLGYAAFVQISFIYSSMANLLGGQRYDLWWYLNRAVLASGFVALLFGLLSQYVHLFRREQERTRQLRESEAHKREFYRRTILAATDGKLVISDREDIDGVVGPALTSWDIAALGDLESVHRTVIEVARDAGVGQQDIYDFLTGVVEMSTNALKHAGGGTASLHRTENSLIFVVSDRGPGMGAMDLPDLALLKGYTTAGTLGMGYKFAIYFADRVYLATGPEGTTVAVEKKLHPEPPDSMSLGQARILPWIK